MVAQQDPAQPRTYEGITVRFTFTNARRRRGWVVTEAAYIPTNWNTYAGGRPIRIQRVVQALARGRGDLARLRRPGRDPRGGRRPRLAQGPRRALSRYSALCSSAGSSSLSLTRRHLDVRGRVVLGRILQHSSRPATVVLDLEREPSTPGSASTAKPLAEPERVASIWRTLVSWALMLSRRWVAAASSRSESVRTRSAMARASLTRLSDRSSASWTIRRAWASAASCSC